MQQGDGSQRHSCSLLVGWFGSYHLTKKLCGVTGAVPVSGTRALALSLHNSEVHSASALLPRFHHVLLGSLKIALKRTRPRQRFLVFDWRYSMTEGGGCQEGITTGKPRSLTHEFGFLLIPKFRQEFGQE